MDLADISSAFEHGATLELKHPATGEPLLDASGKPQTITLAGTDSKRWRRQQDAIGDRLLKSNKGKPVTQTMQERRDDVASLYAAVTLSWNVFVGGEAPECNPVNAKKLYLDYPWIGEQADQFLADRQNFSPASSQS